MPGSVQSHQREWGFLIDWVPMYIEKRLVSITPLMYLISPLNRDSFWLLSNWSGKERGGDKTNQSDRQLKKPTKQNLNCGWLSILFSYLQWNIGVSGILGICISEKVIKLDHRDLTLKS